MPVIGAIVGAIGSAIGGAVAAVGSAVAGTAAAVGGVVAPVVAGVGSTAAAIVGTVGKTVAPVVGAVTGTAGKIASTAVTAVTGLGEVIPATVGGISGVAKAVEPAASLFGAAAGVYSAVKQVGLEEKAIDVAAQTAENQRKALELAALQDPRLYQPDIIEGAPAESPIATVVKIVEPLDPTGQVKVAAGQPQLQEQLMSYAPIILIGIAGIFLVKTWK